MNRAILDTDILSAIMRQDGTALAGAQAYLSVYSQLSISIITRFEILRGLCAKQADSKILAFQLLCLELEILPVTDAVVIRAAQIYGELYRSGKLIGDADLLIAATCFENDCDCVTNNAAHFNRIEGLTIKNWLEKH